MILEAFPVLEMARSGAFEGLEVDDVQDRAEELIPAGLFRNSQSTRLNANLSLPALQGWSLHVLQGRKKVKWSKHGIILVIAPLLKKTYLARAASIPLDGRPVVGLTLRHDRVDNFWFTLLHEIGHVAKHLSKGTLSRG